MYMQLDGYRSFWSKDSRLKFVNILKSIKQDNVKVLAYVISKNSIHLIFFSQDIKDINNFIEKFKQEVIIFLQSQNNKKTIFFRKNTISQNITQKEQFLKYIKLIQEIPKIKSSRKAIFSQPVISFEKDISLLDIPQLKEKYNLTLLDIRRFLSIVDEASRITIDNYNIKQAILIYIQQNKKSLRTILSTNNELKKLVAYLILNNYQIDRGKIAKELKIKTRTLSRKLDNTNPYIKTPLAKRKIGICLNY